MQHWSQDAIFYHIYPLGFCGAPQNNDFFQSPVPRLEKIFAWLDHIQGLGANALYLGPLFESSRHGYDTADYYWVDRRLGRNETLAALSNEIHRRGMRLVLDGVFNHVGRDFWAFRDLRQNGVHSPYTGWFSRLDFEHVSPFGDPFSYEGWNGHFELVRLNQSNPDVKNHLFEAVRTWVRDFDIDGLRLDAADCLEPGFIRDLAAYCHNLRPDFWLLGEVIHGDYRNWANAEMLDSVTNYECYKGLYSSLAEANYFEIAYALNRQFGSGGIYRDLPMYNFVDNHDVDRVASKLAQPAHLYPLYLLLLTMPGVPSIYYGSEWGLQGQRSSTDDSALRPCIELQDMVRSVSQPALPGVIARLAQIRRQYPVFTLGGYRQVFVAHQQLAFCRENEHGLAFVAINAAQQPAAFEITVMAPDGSVFEDVLNAGERFSVQGQKLRFSVAPGWGRILVRV
jgi:glycosidase